MTTTEYCRQIERALLDGNATEHTHRSALKSFVESLDKGITATNEPKRIKCGAPDYIVVKGQTPLGYIEAKDVDESLDKVEKGDQMKRYLESLSNLILTDYLEFRWYVLGKHRMTARLASVGSKRKPKIDKDGAEQVSELLRAFLNAEVPTVASAKELAQRMAAIARLIRTSIGGAFTDEDKGGNLHQQMEGFRKVLLHDLSEAQFADMYAQTICYGLFAARCNVRGSDPFTREMAAFRLPKTNPFLKKMFGHIAGPDLDDRIVWAVDDLASLLHHTDIAAILEDFGKSTRQEDPVVHFYETFLAAYDSKMRESRGVYYTPEPVVSYIVRSVDHILKTDFNLRDGLADSTKIKIKSSDKKSEIETHKVLILDPSTGTGTFLYDVINHIFDSFKNNRGMWSGYVSQHLLPRLFGFELLMAPYAVAHMKLGLQLEQLGYDFKADERLHVYLTNTLDEVVQLDNIDPFSSWIMAEANAAGKIKQDVPVMVVLGNPPYSGHSANTGDWMKNLLHGVDTNTGKKSGNYFEVDGKPLGERNPKWLNNDYIKFLRFAQWRIEQTGYGVLAFITDNSYLQSPTMRGMRQSLMETFDDIYVLDLHGNINKKERSPDGSEDKNVFDIRQGVAIGIYVKRNNYELGTREGTIVRHADLWGVREIYDKSDDMPNLIGGKYHWLWQNDASTTQWEQIEPQSPFYLFVPLNTEPKAEYESGWKLTDCFIFTGQGFTSHRDQFAISFEQNEAEKKLSDFVSSEVPDDYFRETFGLNNTGTWNLSNARKAVRNDKDRMNSVRRCLYRPFDVRYCLLHSKSDQAGTEQIS
jgi:predicted helicase